MPPRPKTPAPALTEEPESAPAAAAGRADAGPEADRGGWFRNTGPTELTVLGEGATAVLAPGRIAALGRTPTHRDLAPASEDDYRAQLAADAARAEAEQTPEPAPSGAAQDSATEA